MKSGVKECFPERLRGVAAALNKSGAEVAEEHVERAGFIVLLVTFINTRMSRLQRCTLLHIRTNGYVFSVGGYLSFGVPGFPTNSCLARVNAERVEITI